MFFAAASDKAAVKIIFAGFIFGYYNAKPARFCQLFSHPPPAVLFSAECNFWEGKSENPWNWFILPQKDIAKLTATRRNGKRWILPAPNAARFWRRGKHETSDERGDNYRTIAQIITEKNAAIPVSHRRKARRPARRYCGRAQICRHVFSGVFCRRKCRE